MYQKILNEQIEKHTESVKSIPEYPNLLGTSPAHLSHSATFRDNQENKKILNKDVKKASKKSKKKEEEESKQMPASRIKKKTSKLKDLLVMAKNTPYQYFKEQDSATIKKDGSSLIRKTNKTSPRSPIPEKHSKRAIVDFRRKRRRKQRVRSEFKLAQAE